MPGHPAFGLIGLASLGIVRREGHWGDPGAQKVGSKGDDDPRLVEAKARQDAFSVQGFVGIQDGGHRQRAVHDLFGAGVLGRELRKSRSSGGAMLCSREHTNLSTRFARGFQLADHLAVGGVPSNRAVVLSGLGGPLRVVERKHFRLSHGAQSSSRKSVGRVALQLDRTSVPALSEHTASCGAAPAGGSDPVSATGDDVLGSGQVGDDRLVDTSRAARDHRGGDPVSGVLQERPA